MPPYPRGLSVAHLVRQVYLFPKKGRNWTRRQRPELLDHERTSGFIHRARMPTHEARTVDLLLSPVLREQGEKRGGEKDRAAVRGISALWLPAHHRPAADRGHEHKSQSGSSGHAGTSTPSAAAPDASYAPPTAYMTARSSPTSRAASFRSLRTSSGLSALPTSPSHAASSTSQ